MPTIGMGSAATSGATAAPAMGAMQAAKAGIQKSDVTQVRHFRPYRRCFPTYRWGRKLARTYYGWRYVPYRYFAGYRCCYGYGYGYGYQEPTTCNDPYLAAAGKPIGRRFSLSAPRKLCGQGPNQSADCGTA